jgi:hypothetical protein
MRTTPETENAEIDDARLALQNARLGLAQAARDVVEANAPILSPLADAKEAQWVRVALLERRERDALTAHARGDRRRERRAQWRHILGIAPARPATIPQPSPTVHEATVSFLDQPGEHNSEEDIHPSALDPVQADLHAALARTSLAKKNAERDARDT